MRRSNGSSFHPARTRSVRKLNCISAPAGASYRLGRRRSSACPAKRKGQQQRVQEVEEIATEVQAPFDPEIDGADIWSDERLDWIGNAARWLVPALAVGGLIVGGFAAKTYNEGAKCDR
jgi:hypothetical protein